MSSSAVDSFIEKWLISEPWHRLLLSFESAQTRPLRSLLECIGFELRTAALDSSDPRVATTKLAWWHEEWQRLANGEPRHPLTSALAHRQMLPIDVQAGARWIDSAWRLAEDVSDPDLPARRRRWQDFTQAQSITLTIDEDARDNGRGHALALLVERLLHWRADLGRGRLPLPLVITAGPSLDRARLAAGDARSRDALGDYARALAEAVTSEAGMARTSPYRRAQLALARLRARQLQRSPALAWADAPPLPPLRSAFAVWRAFRRP
jgi:phytoene synthase